MKSKLKIHSQLYENYAAQDWDGNGDCPQSWKPKGGHTFEIEVDSDVVMYSTKLESHLIEIVASQSNDYEKFEYMEHELEIVQPSVLDSELLYSLINEE
jgi:hypothetical protein